MAEQSKTRKLSETNSMGESWRDARAESKKLGFIRFFEVLYAITLALGLAALMLTSRDDITYDVDTIVTFADLTFAGVALWLIIKRMSAARWVIAVMSGIDIVGEIVQMATGNRTIAGGLVAILVSGLIASYFIFAKRPREVLTREYTAENKTDTSIPSMKTAVFWRDLAMYFCIFAVVGHWMEMGFCQLIHMGLVQGTVDMTNTQLWRDVLFPYTIEGVGFVMCVLLLYPFKNWLQKHIRNRFIPLILSFIANSFVCGLVEFIFGIAINANLQLWDYSSMVGNIMGQVCLQNTLGFGFASTLVTWVIYPFLANMVSRVPKNLMNVIAIAIIMFYLVLQSLYIINIPILQGTGADATIPAATATVGGTATSTGSTTASTVGTAVSAGSTAVSAVGAAVSAGSSTSL